MSSLITIEPSSVVGDASSRVTSSSKHSRRPVDEHVEYDYVQFLTETAAKLKFQDPAQFELVNKSIINLLNCMIDPNTSKTSTSSSAIPKDLREMEKARIDCLELYYETAFELFRRWLVLNATKTEEKRAKSELTKQEIQKTCEEWNDKIKAIRRRDNDIQLLEAKCQDLFRKTQFHKRQNESMLVAMERFLCEHPETIVEGNDLNLARDMFNNHALSTASLISNFRQRNLKIKNYEMSPCAQAMKEHDEETIKKELRKREMMRKKLYEKEICAFRGTARPETVATLEVAKTLYLKLMEAENTSTKILQWKLEHMVDETCQQKHYENRFRFNQFCENLHASSLETLRAKIDRLKIIYERHWHEMMLDKNIYVETTELDSDTLHSVDDIFLARKRILRNKFLMKTQGLLAERT